MQGKAKIQITKDYVFRGGGGMLLEEEISKV